MRIDPEELDALIALFGDPDTVVTEQVDARLASFGPAIVRSLRNRAERESDPQAKERILTRAQSLNTEFKLADFQDFTTRETGPLSLFEGSWILSSLFDFTLQRERYEDLFFRCSQEYLSENSDQRTGVENIRILNHIFFRRLGFTLYDVQLRDRRYAFLGDALRTRTGNPFVLSFIYLMICQVSGLPVELVCFPGGFIPVYTESGKDLFYINIYRGGDIFLQERLGTFLRATGLQIDSRMFRRRDESAMLTLYLESLRYIHAGFRDEKTGEIIERALDCLGPERFLTIDEEG